MCWLLTIEETWSNRIDVAVVEKEVRWWCSVGKINSS